MNRRPFVLLLVTIGVSISFVSTKSVAAFSPLFEIIAFPHREDVTAHSMRSRLHRILESDAYGNGPNRMSLVERSDVKHASNKVIFIDNVKIGFDTVCDPASQAFHKQLHSFPIESSISANYPLANRPCFLAYFSKIRHSLRNNQ